MDKLTVTVIIPTYRPDERFRRLLKRLDRQTERPERILILNTEEAYFRWEDVEGIPNVSVLHIEKSQFDHGGTRDLGARMSDTDLIVFMTMDAVPADRFLLERLKAPFADPRVCVSYARQLPDKHCGELEAYARGFNYGAESCVKTREDLDRLGIKTFFCSNVCAAYRRSAYLELGGFERRTIFNEDMIFAGGLIQAGKAIAYCADARVIHSHNYSGLQQFRRNFDLGVSQAEHAELFRMAKSEAEGIRLVREMAGWLSRSGKIWLLPKLFWQSGCKFLGYSLGKHYRRLPQAMILACTMNRDYWREPKEHDSQRPSELGMENVPDYWREPEEHDSQPYPDGRSEE